MDKLKLVAVAGLVGTFLLASGPTRAQETSAAVAETIVMEEKTDGLRYLAIGAGAIAGVVVLNIITAGVAMPLIGAHLANSGVAVVGAANGAAAGVRLTTGLAATALAAVGGGIVGATLYD
jgi:hypothetical protein|tara:strand:- start:271 stop:633 length:363 start_codon:yes stop_codon:yes gene_type:complete